MMTSNVHFTTNGGKGFFSAKQTQVVMMCPFRPSPFVAIYHNSDWVNLYFLGLGEMGISIRLDSYLRSAEEKSNISWFSISVDDLSRKLRYQTWICVLPLNKKRNRSNQSSHTMTILFSGPCINHPLTNPSIRRGMWNLCEWEIIL